MSVKRLEIEDERSGVQSAETGLAVLMAFVDGEPMPMLKTLAERAGMHPAKVHRYLVSLCRLGFVRQDEETGRYRLGESALRLGYAAMNAIDVVAVARPLLRRLSDERRQTAVLSLWNPMSGPTVAVQEYQPLPFALVTRVGQTLAMLTASAGRTFGAWLPRASTADLVREALAALRGQAMKDVPRDEAEVEAMFAEVRRRGLARSTGQFNPSIHGLSAPVFDGTGGIVAVMTLIGSAGQFDTTWSGPNAVALRASARSLSEALGWSEGTPPVAR